MTPAVEIFMRLWPVAALALLAGVIVLSYRIEARSPDLANRTGVPRMAMWFHTATNRKVARDGKTQRLRRIMLALMLAIVVLFIVVGFVVAGIEEPPA